MKTSEKWDKRFLDLCLTVSQWSKDPRVKVGAVLVRDINKDVVIGYNGFPKGLNDTASRYNNRDLKKQVVIHAEINAILTAKSDLTGYTLYCSLKPCIRCAVTIIQSGIKRVVYKSLTEEEKEKHKNHLEEWELADSLFYEAGVLVEEKSLE